MATRPTFSVNLVAGSEDVENNTSKIKIVLKVTTSDGSYNLTPDDTSGEIKIDGVEVASLDGKTFGQDTTTTLYSKTHTIKHNANGSKKVTVSYRFNTEIGAGVLSDSKTVTLPNIPRTAKLSFPEFTLGKAGTITIETVSGFKNTISYTFEGAAGATIAEETTATSVSFTPPVELAQRIPNDPEGSGVLKVTTYTSSKVLVGSDEFPFKAYVPDSLGPKVTGFTPELESDSAAINEWNVAVKGKSRMKYSATISGQQGATITKKTITFGGVSGETKTPLLTKVGSSVPTLKVTDSRGKTTTVTDDAIEVYDYFKPVLDSSVAFRHVNTEPNATQDTLIARATGTIAAVGDNALTLKARYRLVGAQGWSEYAILTPQQDTELGQIDKTKSYEVEFTAVDAVDSGVPVVVVVSTEDVAFHIMNGGKGAAFGKYAESENMLDIAWDTLKVGGKTLLDLIHPVGSLYWSSDPTDPATLFGGTWNRIKDVFVLAAGDTYQTVKKSESGKADKVAGDATVKLTADQLPKLSGTINFRPWGSGSPYVGVSGIVSNYGSIGQTENAFPTSTSSGSLRQLKIAFGGDAAHENMPPYAVKYCWERTA